MLCFLNLLIHDLRIFLRSCPPLGKRDLGPSPVVRTVSYPGRNAPCARISAATASYLNLLYVLYRPACWLLALSCFLCMLRMECPSGPNPRDLRPCVRNGTPELHRRGVRRRSAPRMALHPVGRRAKNELRVAFGPSAFLSACFACLLVTSSPFGTSRPGA